MSTRHDETWLQAQAKLDKMRDAQVWHVVLADCHDAVLKVCATEEIANGWRDYYAKKRGTECAEVRGYYCVETELPEKK